MGGKMRRFGYLLSAFATVFVGCAQVSRVTGIGGYTRVGNELRVPAGGDLQNALNDAKAGDHVVLEAGGLYKGEWKLPLKPEAPAGTDPWITIRTSAIDKLPPEGTRVKPEHAEFMPALICKNCPALSADKFVHHYRIVGLELYPEKGVYADTLITFGTGQDKDVEDLPHDFEVDRSILHGDYNKGSKRGISFNGKSIVVKNSHLVDFFSDFQDAQAILGWNGPGPFKIINNHLEASGENVMFGGAAPRIQGLIPSDIEILRNHFYKPERLRPISQIKNLFELKIGQRVRVEGNVFENNWPGAQNGFGILFTVRTCEAGDYSWSTIAEVDFRNNIIKNSKAGAFNIMGKDDVRKDCLATGRFAGVTKNIRIENNLLLDVGVGFQILSGSENVRIAHNTLMNTGAIVFAAGIPSPGLVVESNIGMYANSGIWGDSHSRGNLSIDHYFPNSRIRANVMIGGDGLDYPKGNFFPEKFEDVGFLPNYALGPKSKYRGKSPEKKDLGADIAAIEAATKGVVEGLPAQ